MLHFTSPLVAASITEPRARWQAWPSINRRRCAFCTTHSNLTIVYAQSLHLFLLLHQPSRRHHCSPHSLQASAVNWITDLNWSQTLARNTLHALERRHNAFHRSRLQHVWARQPGQQRLWRHGSFPMRSISSHPWAVRYIVDWRHEHAQDLD